ncbi:MAG: DUF4386 domain-containing protein [Saprospiraceae bacterium]
MNGINDKEELKPYALIGGISLLVMALAAVFSVGAITRVETGGVNGGVLIDQGLLRQGIGGWILILITDVVVAWALYVLLKPVHRLWSLLAGWIRLVYAAILGTGIGFLFLALQTMEQSGQADDLLHYVGTFRDIWSFGLIMFGIHLLILGPLCIRSGYIPRLLGYLIAIAGAGYLIIHLGHLLIPGFDPVQKILEMVFMLPMLLGELGLAIWLLARAKNLTKRLIAD